MIDKKADMAGPGIGNYAELEKILPQDYSSLLSPKDTQKAVFAVKNYIEENLCKELNLMMVAVPLIVDVDSGVMTSLTEMVREPPSNSIFQTTMTRIQSMHRLSKRQLSGNVLP